MADTAYHHPSPEEGDLRWIDIDRIDPAEDNPRRKLTDISMST